MIPLLLVGAGALIAALAGKKKPEAKKEEATSDGMGGGGGMSSNQSEIMKAMSAPPSGTLNGVVRAADYPLRSTDVIYMSAAPLVSPVIKLDTKAQIPPTTNTWGLPLNTSPLPSVYSRTSVPANTTINTSGIGNTIQKATTPTSAGTSGIGAVMNTAITPTSLRTTMFTPHVAPVRTGFFFNGEY